MHVITSKGPSALKLKEDWFCQVLNKVSLERVFLEKAL